MAYIAGLDIGGTKLAVLLAKAEDGVVTPLAKRKFPTPKGGYPPAREAMCRLCLPNPFAREMELDPP